MPLVKRIFKAKFGCMYPVGCGLIIAADNEAEALRIATETVEHTDVTGIEEIDTTKSGVVFYLSGEY